MQPVKSGSTTRTVLVLSGPSGAGKSTVGSKLAQCATEPTVHLCLDNFHVAIKQGFVVPFHPGAARQNAVVIEAMIASALAYFRGGYDVVIDGTIGPRLLQAIVDATAHANLPLSFVVLRPDFAETRARAMARMGMPFDVIEGSTPLKTLYDSFANLNALEAHVIDSSPQTADETVELVQAGLVTGRFLLSSERMRAVSGPRWFQWLTQLG